MGWRRACPRSSSSRSASRIPSPTARMAAAAPGPGETFWQFRHYDQNDSRFGHRLAALGELGPSLRARARMGSGAYRLAVGRSLGVDAVPLVACPRPPRRAAASCSRLRLPSFSPAAASASACFGGRPFTGRAAARRVAEVLLGDTSEASLPPNAKLSRFSECLLFSDFLEPVGATADRSGGRSRRRACAAISFRCSIPPRRRCLTPAAPSSPRAKAGTG